MGSSYRFRVLTHIVYSAIITCLVEVFLITNLSMVARYIQQSGKVSALVHFILEQHLAVVILYVLVGIVIFSVTFMILEEPGIRYLGRISDAVQSISQGNLNTEVDVTCLLYTSSTSLRIFQMFWSRSRTAITSLSFTWMICPLRITSWNISI